MYIVGKKQVNIVDELNDSIDIIELVSKHVKLEKKGKNYFGLCPFHDDNNPSMSVSPEANIFKCFSCGVGGKPLQFYQMIHGISFDEAVKRLSDGKLEIEVVKTLFDEVSSFYQYNLYNSESGKSVLEYLYKRGLTDNTIKHFELGYAPINDVVMKLLLEKGFTLEEIFESGLTNKHDYFKDRLIIPIKSGNNVIAFSGRSLNGKPKYLNTRFEKGGHLYNLVNDKEIILTEGYFDVMMAFQFGIKNVVAVMGNSISKEQVSLLKGRKITLAFDGDAAGLEGMIKSLERLKGNYVNFLPLDDDLDSDLRANKGVLKGFIDEYEFRYRIGIKNLNKGELEELVNSFPLDVKKRYVKETVKERLKKLMKELEEIMEELENENNR